MYIYCLHTIHRFHGLGLEASRQRSVTIVYLVLAYRKRIKFESSKQVVTESYFEFRRKPPQVRDAGQA